MAFITDIEDALLTVLNDELTIPVIIAHENAPEPQGDYGVIRYVVADKVHRNEVSHNRTEDGLEEVIRQVFRVRFNVKFYGESCHDNAFLSQAILASHTIQAGLYQDSQLSYADVTSVQNNPEFRPTGFIDRSIYDISFLTGFEYKRITDWFNKVSYEGDYVDSEGNLILTPSDIVEATDADSS